MARSLECEKFDIEFRNQRLYECPYCHGNKHKFHILRWKEKPFPNPIIYIKCCECGNGIRLKDLMKDV